MKLTTKGHYAIIFWLALSLTPAFAASFQPLGDLPGGSFSSSAWSVSADGSVVVGESISASGTEAFRWTRSGGMVGLGDLPGGIFYSSARDVSGDGLVTVGESFGAYSTENPEAFRHTLSSGMVGMGFLGLTEFESTAEAVSYDGSVIVGRTTVGQEGHRTAFRWTASENMVQLLDPSGASYSSFAREISADGQVIVGFYEPSPEISRMAFRWTSAEGFVPLGYLPGTDFHSTSRACSADGSVIVGSTGFYEQEKDEEGEYLQAEAFRWIEAGGMIGLGELPGGAFFSWGLSVSADGSVVVGYSKTETADEAFIWDSVNGMRNLKDVLMNTYGLDLAGWTLNYATDISADGMIIVGAGTNPSGQMEAWIVDLEGANEANGFLLFDDFTTTLAQWSVRGVPLPSIVSDEGNPSPCFSTNGDSDYASLAVSKNKFSYEGINFNASVDMKAGSDYEYATFALTKSNVIGGTDWDPTWQYIILVSLLSNQHSPGPGVVFEMRYEDDGEKVENSGFIPILDGDGWHNIMYRIREIDGKVELYCDGELIHTSVHSLTTLYSGSAAVGLGNRLAWHDNVKVFSENADFDQDGDVDGTDLWLFRQHFFQSAVPADLSKDNQVDGLDVGFFGANLGKPY